MTDYVRPEMLILIPALVVIGKIFSDADMVKNKYIPMLLGISGVVLSALYTISLYGLSLDGIFSGIVQGILCAGTAVYGNQIYKQLGKEE
jgi:hypothetical protein|nr:MAG TPA: holin [Caudoviricetes sp.]